MRTQQIDLVEDDYKKRKAEHKERKFALRLRSLLFYLFCTFCDPLCAFVAPLWV